MVNLATPRQSPTDQFSLIETALASQRADSPPVIVALEFGVPRLRWTTEQTLVHAMQPRLGLTSAWADDEVRSLGGTPPVRFGLYAYDNLDFILLNGSESLIRVMLQRPARRIIDQCAVGSPHHDAQLRKRLGQDIRAGGARQGGCLAQIGRLAARIAAIPNTTLVLVEESLSPDLIADEGLDPVRDRLTAAVTPDLPAYWPISTEAALIGDDFFDDLHMRLGPPQDRVRAALAGHVIGLQLATGVDGRGN